jgi:hypothetical protein
MRGADRGSNFVLLANKINSLEGSLHQRRAQNTKKESIPQVGLCFRIDSQLRRLARHDAHHVCQRERGGEPVALTWI